MNRRILEACVLVLALIAALTVGGMPSAMAAGGVVVLDSLTVPSGVVSGQSVSASARVHASSGTVAVQAITVAVRGSDGSAYDFPGATAASIPASGYTFTSGSRTFAAGTYDAFAAVEINGQWTDLSPHRTLTVAASNPVTFFQDFTGPAGQTANYGRVGTWFNDPCWQNGCTGTMAQYKEDHARLDGQGSLVLTADRSPDAGTMCGPARCTYAAARLTMLDWAGNGGHPSWSQAGGHVEARIRTTAGQGLWPAFWMVGNQYDTNTWPGTGEIDVLEAIGQAPRDVEQHAHGGVDEAHDINWGGGYLLPSGDITGWHTYAIDWNAAVNGYITWSVDGVATRTLTAAAAGSAWSSFRGPQALILNLAVGGDFPGPPGAGTVFPAHTWVDYVRVNQNPMK